MLSANNLLEAPGRRPVTVPTQDMVLGSYYLTIGASRTACSQMDKGDTGPRASTSTRSSGLMPRAISACIYRRGRGADGLRRTSSASTIGSASDGPRRPCGRATVGRIIFNRNPPGSGLRRAPRASPRQVLRLEVTVLRQEAAGQDRRPHHHASTASPSPPRCWTTSRPPATSTLPAAPSPSPSRT